MKSVRPAPALFVSLLAAALLSSSPRAQYTYNKYLEPPEGQVVQGIGQFMTPNQTYLAAIGETREVPLPGLFLSFVNISPTLSTDDCNRPFDEAKAAEQLGAWASHYHNARIPVISISFHLSHSCTETDLSAHDDTLVFDPEDPEYDETAQEIMEDQITLLGETIAEFGQPVFVRIGVEVNNDFGDAVEPYHEDHFAEAYRKTVALLQVAGALQCSYVWCWYAGADPILASSDWYPGDEYVDWYGLDVFTRNDFTNLISPVGGSTSHLADVDAFLDEAHTKGRPVMIAEASCADYEIEAGDPNDAWINWFEPFLDFLAGYPGIKAVNYISQDWHDGGGGESWLDAQIANDAPEGPLFTAWVDTISDEPFVGALSFLDFNDGWFDLSYSLAGTAGAPLLEGEHPVRARQPVALHLSNAAPSASSWLITGGTASYTPYKGGVRVPTPTVVTPLTTNPGGALNLNFNWPDVPEGTELYFQFWITDAGGPEGFAASNALKAVTL